MRYFTSTDQNGICTGLQTSDGDVTGPNVVEVTNAVSVGVPLDDFMYRKYVGGAWSTEKYLPPAPVPGLDVPVEIDQLKAQDTEINLQIIDLFEQLMSKGVL